MDEHLQPKDPSFRDLLAQGDAWRGVVPGHWRRWSVRLLALTLVGLVMLAAMNVVVNPRAEFPHRLYPPLVGDEPLSKLDAYQGLADPPSRLILGSSRVAALPAGNATAAGFNFGVSTGGLRDARLAYEFVRDRQGPPDHVVFALDSYLLNLDPADHSAFEASAGAQTLTGSGSDPQDWVRLAALSLTTSYVLDSVRSLRYAHGEGYPAPSRTVDGHGVRISTLADQQISAGTYDREAAVRSIGDLALRVYPNGTEADAGAMRFAKALVEEMLADGATVQVVFMPLHPEVLPRLKERQGYATLEAAARTAMLPLCGPALSVHDLADPAATGLATGDFYDAWHLAPRGAQRVALALEGSAPDLCAR